MWICSLPGSRSPLRVPMTLYVSASLLVVYTDNLIVPLFFNDGPKLYVTLRPPCQAVGAFFPPRALKWTINLGF